MNMHVVGLADKASAMLGKELAEHDLSVVETSFGRSLRTEKHFLLGCALFLHPCVLQSAYADEFLRTCAAAPKVHSRPREPEDHAASFKSTSLQIQLQSLKRPKRHSLPRNPAQGPPVHLFGRVADLRVLISMNLVVG